MDLARIESGSYRKDFVETDLVDAVEQFRAAMRICSATRRSGFTTRRQTAPGSVIPRCSTCS